MRNLHVFFAVTRSGAKRLLDEMDARGSYDAESRIWYVDSDGIRARVMFRQEAELTIGGQRWLLLHCCPVGSSPPRKLVAVGKALYRRLANIGGVRGPWSPRQLDAYMGDSEKNPMRRHGETVVPWVIYGEDPRVSTEIGPDDEP